MLSLSGGKSSALLILKLNWTKPRSTRRCECAIGHFTVGSGGLILFWNSVLKDLFLEVKDEESKKCINEEIPKKNIN